MSREIVIENCKSIDEARFSIKEKCLNIKFAPNGTGKTAIFDGLKYGIRKDESFGRALVPFKYRSMADAPKFKISGIDDYRTVETFDESYVNSVAYVGNEVFSNSFDVFVKTPEYLRTVQEIEQLLKDVTDVAESDSLKELINCLGTLIPNICGNGGLTVNSELKGTAPAVKGMLAGNPKKGVPSEYRCLLPYIDSEQFSDWAKWHTTGEKLVDDNNDVCPFCGKDIGADKSDLLKVSEVYPSASASNFNKFSSSIILAKDYFSGKTREELQSIHDSGSALTDMQKGYLAEVVGQAMQITDALTRGRALGSYFDLAAAGENIENRINDSRIELKLLSHFNSAACERVIDDYNAALERVSEKSKELLGIVNRQKDKLGKALKGYEEEINAFLASGGYPYIVRIDVLDKGDCKVKLVHESKAEVDDVQGALSYGERNALALVFFMYSALSAEPDLIVLDDPITSFDGHKRFAILNMLFLKEDGNSRCLKNRTVLLLTHDYGVVFDLEHTLKSEFQPMASTAFLSIRNGVLSEKVISSLDMQPVRKLYTSLSEDSKDPFVRFAYKRKIVELDGDKGPVWDVLSSLFHHKSKPADRDGVELIPKVVEEASAEIRRDTGCPFDYTQLYRRVSDAKAMYEAFQSAQCNYEKLQIARISLNGCHVDRVAKKMLDETLHVDNGYIFQLDPREFELVPESLIARCESFLRKVADSQ